MRKITNNNKKIKILFFINIIIFTCVLLESVAFSSFSNTLDMSNLSASVRIDKDIKVTKDHLQEIVIMQILVI